MLLRQQSLRSQVLSTGVHTFGLCATALITNVLQLMTGNPTPYFLTVCKPNYSSLNTSCEQNPYIMEDICTGADQAAISQGRSGLRSLKSLLEPGNLQRSAHTRMHVAKKHMHSHTCRVRRKTGGSSWLEESRK